MNELINRRRQTLPFHFLLHDTLTTVALLTKSDNSSNMTPLLMAGKMRVKSAQNIGNRPYMGRLSSNIFDKYTFPKVTQTIQDLCWFKLIRGSFTFIGLNSGDVDKDRYWQSLFFQTLTDDI